MRAGRGRYRPPRARSAKGPAVTSITFELLVIMALILANGAFSMAEIAIVSARKGRLRQRADGGDVRARAALELAGAPNTFLSTVQIGITLVGVLAAAFGGATLAERLAEQLARWPALAPYAKNLSLAFVVALVTYLTLVVGELVPKRLGLRNPEGIARLVARPMMRLSRLAAPLVTLLGRSTDALLRLLRLKPVADQAVSEDDVRLLVTEGMRAGVFHPSEPALVDRVMALDRTTVRDLMTPRSRIIWINVRDAHEAVWHRIVVSGHSTFPVYEETHDQVVGLLSVKAIYANLAAGASVRVRDLMTPPLIVPANILVPDLLDQFRQAGRFQALVADERGGVVGLISLHDVMAAILGEIPSAHARAAPRAVRRADGSWLVEAGIAVADFGRQVAAFPLPAPEQRNYDTFAGFVVNHLGRVPAEGDSFQHGGFQVEIIEMDGPRVDKVLLLPLRTPPPEAQA